MKAEPSSRTRLFDCFALRRPVIFRDFIVKLSQGQAPYNGDVVNFLRRALPKRQGVRTRIGPRQEFRSIPIGDVLGKWEPQHSLVTVTDLHFRGTRLEKRIDVNALSDFDLLLLGSEELALQEMMTLVVSSAGTFTDNGPGGASAAQSRSKQTTKTTTAVNGGGPPREPNCQPRTVALHEDATSIRPREKFTMVLVSGIGR
jgi:hypothetical protein